MFMTFFSRIALKYRISISTIILSLFLFISACTHTQPQAQKTSSAPEAVSQQFSAATDPATIRSTVKSPLIRG